MTDRFKFRIWDKESQKYHNGMEVFDYMRGVLIPDKYVIEQCPDEWEFEDIPHIEYNEFTVWQPVARDLDFEKHIAKLKAMKQFNEGR